MSLNDSRITLFNYFKNNWNDSIIVFEGQKHGERNLKQSNPWLYSYIVWHGHSTRSHAAASQVYFTTLGILSIKLYVKEDSGMAPIDILTDSLFSLFHARKIDNITVDDMYVIHTEPYNTWTVRYIDIPFSVQTFEEIT